MRKDLELLIRGQRYPHLTRGNRKPPPSTQRTETPTSSQVNSDRERIIQKIQKHMRDNNNINNVNLISDAEGLYKSYRTGTGLYKFGNTLYVSGTSGKNLANDIFSDIFHIPFNRLEESERYKDAYEMLQTSPEVTRLVGHSLGSAVVKVLNKNSNDKYAENLYSSPIISLPSSTARDDNHLNFRTALDPVAVLDTGSITVPQGTLNPHSYFNFFDQGRSEFNTANNTQPVKKIM